MSWTDSGIRVLDLAREGDTLRLTAACDDPARLMQCYLSGRLAAVQETPRAIWRLTLPAPQAHEALLLLAVDPDEAEVNYWSAARPAAAANRIAISLPATMTGRLPGQRWRVGLASPGAASAALEHEAEIHPGGYGGGGFGSGLAGAFGYGGADAPGWSAHFGLGEFGFDCRLLRWTSEPLAPGSYRVEIDVIDATGRSSALHSQTVEIAAPPRPASGLTLLAYNVASATLTLGFTPSPDLST